MFDRSKRTRKYQYTLIKINKDWKFKHIGEGKLCTIKCFKNFLTNTEPSIKKRVILKDLY